MAKTKISEFSATPANNTDIDSINIAEGCAPSGINDAIRELMAQLKDFQTGAQGDSFNGPIGSTTPAAGAFTTLSASSTVSGTGFSTYLASPPAIGGTAAAAGAFTTLSASSTVTLSGGTANGVTYLNGSKVLTSGSALTFDGNTLTAVNTSGNAIIASRGSKDLRLTGNYAGANTHAVISTTTGMALAFMDESNEYMRLTSTGLGIGTSSPSFPSGSGLAIYNSSVPRLKFSNSTTGDASTDGTNLLVSGSDFYIQQREAASVIIATNGADRATIDSAGNLLLGVTSSTGLTGTGDFAMPNNRAIRFRNAANSAYLNMIYVDTSNNLNFGFGGVPPNITFGINGIGEVSRFDSSGNLLVGDTTNTGTSKMLVVADTNSFNIFTIKDTGTTYNTSKWYQQFLNSTNGVAGSIQHSSVTGVTYATSSDSRLKENVETAPDALAKVLTIPVRSFDWKIDEAHVDYGFIAQELYQVVPEAVGKGDDTEELTDPKGTWQVEYGRLTPLLVKAIQEQQAIIESLKARLDAANL